MKLDVLFPGDAPNFRKVFKAAAAPCTPIVKDAIFWIGEATFKAILKNWNKKFIELKAIFTGAPGKTVTRPSATQSIPLAHSTFFNFSFHEYMFFCICVRITMNMLSQSAIPVFICLENSVISAVGRSPVTPLYQVDVTVFLGGSARKTAS